MCIKKSDVSLYVAIMCLVGVGLVFFFDAFYGVRETLLYIKEEAGDVTEMKEIDFSRPPLMWRNYVDVDQGGNIYFRYSIVNNRFTSLSEQIEIALYTNTSNGPKVYHLVSQKVNVDAWGAHAILWSVETENLEPNTYVLKIEGNGAVRKIWIEVFKRLR